LAEVTASRRRFSQPVRWVGLHLLLVFGTLAAIEMILVIVHPRYLQIIPWDGVHISYDPELGWAPIPGAAFEDDKMRPHHVVHNSLGLRDVEFVRGSKPTILVLGDSLVYGTNVQAEERFTDLLRRQLPEFSIVNAGIPGYGTDQEYLLMRRLWNEIAPKVVVLTVCLENDRRDNTRNIRYDTYKPYLKDSADGTAQFSAPPVPKSRSLYYRESWLAQHLYLARLAISAYVELKYPRIEIPDPTERLVGMMRDFVEAKGATLVVGLEYRDEPLEAYLRREQITYTSFEGAPDFAAEP